MKQKLQFQEERALWRGHEDRGEKMFNNLAPVVQLYFSFCHALTGAQMRSTEATFPRDSLNFLPPYFCSSHTLPNNRNPLLDLLLSHYSLQTMTGGDRTFHYSTCTDNQLYHGSLKSSSADKSQKMRDTWVARLVKRLPLGSRSWGPGICPTSGSLFRWETAYPSPSALPPLMFSVSRSQRSS